MLSSHVRLGLRPCQRISPGPRHLFLFCNYAIFYGEELLALHPTPTLEDQPLLVVCDCLFNVVTQHNGDCSSWGNTMLWWQGPTYHGYILFTEKKPRLATHLYIRIWIFMKLEWNYIRSFPSTSMFTTGKNPSFTRSISRSKLLCENLCFNIPFLHKLTVSILKTNLARQIY